MNSAKSYLLNAKNGSGPRHKNFIDSGRKSFVAQPAMTMNATGSSGVATSQPYIVIVSSASAGATANFSIFDSYKQLYDGSIDQATGNRVVGPLTVSSGIPDITYRDLLAQVTNQPFTCGLTYLECTNVPAQVNKVFTISTKDASGSQLSVPIVSLIDPYQQQLSINVCKQEYRIDGNTKMTFSSILANAVITISIFPADNLNPARALSGSSTTKQYADPGIIR